MLVNAKRVSEAPAPYGRRRQRASLPRRRKPRLYFDEQLPISIVERLQQQHSGKFNVVHAISSGNSGREDQFHYEFARRTHRILVSRDSHYLDDRKFPLHMSPGVVVIDVSPPNEDEKLTRVLWHFLDFMRTAGHQYAARTKFVASEDHLDRMYATKSGAYSERLDWAKV